MAAAAATTHHIAFHECHLQENVAPDSIFPLRNLKLVTANYEIFSHAKRNATPAASYLRTRKLFGAPEHDKSVRSLEAATQSQSSVPSVRGNG